MRFPAAPDARRRNRRLPHACVPGDHFVFRLEIRVGVLGREPRVDGKCATPPEGAGGIDLNHSAALDGDRVRVRSIDGSPCASRGMS